MEAIPDLVEAVRHIRTHGSSAFKKLIEVVDGPLSGAVTRFYSNRPDLVGSTMPYHVFENIASYAATELRGVFEEERRRYSESIFADGVALIGGVEDLKKKSVDVAFNRRLRHKTRRQVQKLSQDVTKLNTQWEQHWDDVQGITVEKVVHGVLATILQEHNVTIDLNATTPPPDWDSAERWGEVTTELQKVSTDVEVSAELDSAVRSAVWPPLDTAQNIEINLMSLGHVHAVFDEVKKRYDSSTRPKLGLVASKHTYAYARAVTFFSVGQLGADPSDTPSSEADFFWVMSIDWRAAGFARLEVSHKLAAEFMFTDVGNVEVRAPWKTWSLIVPPGLLQTDDFDLLRVWCAEADGKRWLVREKDGFKIYKPEDFTRYPIHTEMVDALVKSCCLASSDPDRWRKGKWGSSKTDGGKRRHGELPEAGARYVLGMPVTIDLREQVREVLRRGSRKGSSPKVQFPVRGHWRQQAYGPKLSLRRPQWIEPFWKGSPEARVLLRGHKIEEKEED